jgi:nickel-dependent lactate racemase
MGTSVRLPYGDAYVSVTLPAGNRSYILTGQHLPGLKDEQEAIREALRKPLGCPGLNECIQKNDKVAVITTDNTRPCPDGKILPVILAALEPKIPKENVTIVVALGLHAPLNRKELIQKFGRNIMENYRVINHNTDQTTFLGTTSFGTPVEVNAEVVRADFRISTGFIEPHFFAGFSGGRKSIAPGVSSARAIRYNHRYEMVAHPNARAGILKGNPIHEDMVAQAKMAKLDFIVNVLLNQERQITHVFAGSPWLAHEKGCEMERGMVCVELDHKVDVTIVSNGGAPLDLDFYQTCKGIDTAAQITRSGGTIIMASSCSHGLGPEAFRSLHASAHSPEEVMKLARDSEHAGVAWQNQILARAQIDHTVYLLSELEDNLVRQMMVTPIHTFGEGWHRAFEVLGRDAEVAVIPEGPLVLPEVNAA